VLTYGHDGTKTTLTNSLGQQFRYAFMSGASKLSKTDASRKAWAAFNEWNRKFKSTHSGVRTTRVVTKRSDCRTKSFYCAVWFSFWYGEKPKRIKKPVAKWPIMGLQSMTGNREFLEENRRQILSSFYLPPEAFERKPYGYKTAAHPIALKQNGA